MKVMKRKKDVRREKILRVRVARLSWALESSGTTVGELVEDAVFDRWRRLKNRIVKAAGSVIGREIASERQIMRGRVLEDIPTGLLKTRNARLSDLSKFYGEQ